MDSRSNSSTTDSVALRPLARCLFVTLGCAKNEVDTDRMRALLLRAGFSEAQDVDGADVILINTCSFLGSATAESIEATLELADDVKGCSTSRPIIMCGCVPSRYGGQLADDLPEVCAFVRADEEDGIVEVVSDVLGIERERTGPYGVCISDRSFLRTIEGTSAYVKISEGCDRFCSFCAIPLIRGGYASRPPDEILAEVRALMEGGVREVVLIGQDTGVWGTDLPQALSLAWLLRGVARVARPFGGWVRVLYLQPEGMTDELIAAMRDVPEVLPYVDIPIQHCSERVLRGMGRGGSARDLRRLFSRLRSEIDGIVLRTTGLVGFPGETEQEFAELVDFIREEEFDYTSVFSYSREDGTRAAAMPGQLCDEDKLEREQRLHDVAEELGFAATASHVGEVVDVIIDGVEGEVGDGELIGHAWFQAPDCDGAVHIASGEASVGDVVRVRLVGSFCYELDGEILEG